MDPSTATYDKGGNLMCPRCAAGVMIMEGDQRAVGSLVTSALAVPALGIVSWTCVNQFAIVSIITIISGVAWLVAIGRQDEYRRRMGNKFIPCLIAVIIGGLMGIFSLLVFGGAMLLSVFNR
jgi:hypothetical protein